MIMRKLRHFIAKRRAARDVVRMNSAALTADQQIQIAEWQSKDFEYQEHFRAANGALADLRGLENDPDILALIGESAPVYSKQETKVTQRYRWPKLAAAAAVIVAIVVGYQSFQVQDRDQADLYRYVTRIGEQKDVKLADGSEVTLNTGTLMLVEMTESGRRVILERGEAYFDVAKDSDRPFTVEMERQAVTVLGTQFNIRVTPEQFTLALVEGSVALHPDYESVIPDAPLLEVSSDHAATVSAARQLRIAAGTVVNYKYDSKNMTAYADAKIEKRLSWRAGVLRFDSVPLKQLIQELNRYSAKKILIEDTDIMDLKVYATVRVDRLDLALNDLEYTLPVEVVQYFDRVVIKRDSQ
ncbi:FecR domain-containing protein [Porticoccaceae bacterium LTM1]|nr:FecR domain-containing protein [Porticoccaceae bacterium LTM1]